MDTSLPEVYPIADPCPNFPGPVDAQLLCEKNVDKDKGTLRVPTLIEYYLALHGQGHHKPAPYYYRGHGIPAG